MHRRKIALPEKPVSLGLTTVDKKNVVASSDSQSIGPTQGSATTPVLERPIPRVYHKPKVTDFGTIAKLTQSGNGSGVDGGTTAGMTMMCL